MSLAPSSRPVTSRPAGAETASRASPPRDSGREPRRATSPVPSAESSVRRRTERLSVFGAGATIRLGVLAVPVALLWSAVLLALS